MQKISIPWRGRSCAYFLQTDWGNPIKLPTLLLCSAVLCNAAWANESQPEQKRAHFSVDLPLVRARRQYGDRCGRSRSPSRSDGGDPAASSYGELEATPGKPLKKALQIAVCVPFPYLAQTQTLLNSSCIAWGVQDVSAHAQGAYTGEVSAAMAAEFGATFALIGHSERRAHHQESDQVVAEKALRALDAGLTPVVCVGETRAERDAGRAERTVKRQLQRVLDVLTAKQAAQLVIAYEPVWAIGAGKSAQADEVRAIHSVLHRTLAALDTQLAHVPVLYGGSVKPDNARALFREPGIDGGLIGGASLKADDFLQICAAAATP